MGFCLKNQFMVLFGWSKIIFTVWRSFPNSKTKWPPVSVMSVWPGNQFLVLFSWLEVIFKVKKSMSRSTKQNYYFYQMKLGTCVIPLLHGIWTGHSISEIIIGFSGGHFWMGMLHYLSDYIFLQKNIANQFIDPARRCWHKDRIVHAIELKI